MPATRARPSRWPSLEGVAQGHPEAGLLELVGQGAEDLAGRGEGDPVGHHLRGSPRSLAISSEVEDAVLIGRGAQRTGGTRLAERRNLALQRKPTPAVNDLWLDPIEPAG
jgi:hypothetical protein